MDHYKSLQNYYKSGGVLHSGKDPVWGEIGYKEYMRQKIFDMGIKQGDTIRVDQKRHYGEVVHYEGIMLHIYNDRLRMISKGKKVWKDRSNENDVRIENITKIEKIKEAEPDLNIYVADPNYKNYKYVQEHLNDQGYRDTIEAKRISMFQENIKEIFPNIDHNKNVILYLLFDFYWDYAEGTLKEAEINIIKKNGESISVPKYKNKHIYQNQSYFSCCGVKYTDKKFDGILILFDSFKELNEIRLISCKWTIEIDKQLQLMFMQMIYPTFTEGEYKVYNISCRCTDMQTYEDALHKPTVFSGMLEKKYDKAFVVESRADKDSESVIEIMNADDAESYLLDFYICVNNNDMEKIFNNCHDFKQKITEVFIKYVNVEPKGYTLPYQNKNN